MSRLAGTSRPDVDIPAESLAELRAALDRALAAMRQVIVYFLDERTCDTARAHEAMLRRIVDAPFDPSAARLVEMLQRYDELNGVACSAQDAYERAEKFRKACWEQLQEETRAVFCGEEVTA